MADKKSCTDCGEKNRYQSIVCTSCIRSSHYEMAYAMTKREWIDNWKPKGETE